MQVKTFTGASTQEVLAQIKAELGQDAVILGSREIRQGGGRLFEITAGLERPQAGPAGVSSGATPPGWEEWHQEWSRVKGHLYALMQPAIKWEKLSPRQRMALEYLQREGVEDDVMVELYEALLKAPPTSTMLGALAEKVPVRAFDANNWPQRLHILAGPFGSGKTTTALRLAMLLRKKEPGRRVAFLNADSSRGNGRLVLRHWAELSDFQYFETPDAQAMQAALKASREAATVFIDMPGLGRGEKLPEKLGALGLAGVLAEAALHLVLPPHYGSLQQAAFLKQYQAHLPSSLIWTKLDEAAVFGPLVNVAVRSGMCVSALSYGAELKASLIPAEEGRIWRLLLKRQLPDNTNQGLTEPA